MTAGVEGSVEPDDAALDNLRDRRPGVFGDGVPVPAVDQGVRGEDKVGSMSRRLTPFLATRKMWRWAFVPGAKPVKRAIKKNCTPQLHTGTYIYIYML